MPTTADEVKILRAMVRGAYDLQLLRMQSGLRLCANFRAKLKQHALDEEALEEGEELSEEALNIIKKLKDSYKRLTDGVARNRRMPAEAGFIGDELISTFSELTLVNQYVRIEENEVDNFKNLTSTLEKIPIYTHYLADVKGIGPAMAAVLISGFDVYKARYASSFWRYAGLDLGPDGLGRSRRQGHLVERAYIDRSGREAMRMGVTYNPWLKTKLMGVLASSFLRSASPWRQVYDNYKHRIESDPGRKKVTIAEYKRLHREKADTSQLWPPGRVHKAALRYMIKLFLADFWGKWRALEGLPVAESYAEGKLDLPPHAA
jgi:hypothetical protein